MPLNSLSCQNKIGYLANNTFSETVAKSLYDIFFSYVCCCSKTVDNEVIFADNPAELKKIISRLNQQWGELAKTNSNLQKKLSESEQKVKSFEEKENLNKIHELTLIDDLKGQLESRNSETQVLILQLDRAKTALTEKNVEVDALNYKLSRATRALLEIKKAEAILTAEFSN
jgi:chromosome segregation ATPase